MQSKVAMLNPVRAGFATCLLLLGAGVQAEIVEETPSVGVMLADAALARPLYFVMSQAGALLYTVTLPFSALGGNDKAAAEAMVITPLQATFTRCLGCGKSINSVSELKDGEGKNINHFLQLSAGLVSMTSGSEDGTAIGAGFYYGTHFALADRSRFDVMLGYKSLGEVEFGSGAGKYTDSVTSWQAITRVGRAITDKSDLMFKLGLHRWSVDETSSTATGSTDGFGFLYGLGLDFAMNSSWRAGFDVTRYNMKDDSLGYDASATTMDVTVGYYF